MFSCLAALDFQELLEFEDASFAAQIALSM
jgi:hypothetical protein